jgi:MoxR-like ATPase
MSSNPMHDSLPPGTPAGTRAGAPSGPAAGAAAGIPAGPAPGSRPAPSPRPLAAAETAEACAAVIREVEKAVVGKRAVLEMMMAAMLCPGAHILLEDYPGLAKTLIANSFAEALGMSFKRIQFTPDLLPGDITGGYVFASAESRFVLRRGPIFAQLVLADEINRASPKTQSALLEAMQERQVTLEGERERLPVPFIVIATQNPIEHEGTFPLPEAQLDRFAVRLSVGYPTAQEEAQILRERADRMKDTVDLHAVIGPEALLAMRETVERVFVDPDVGRYIVGLVGGTREHRQVVVGASPRASLALLKLARAWAAMQGRDFVIPDDVKPFVQPVLAHRVILDPSLWDVRMSDRGVVEEVLRSVPVPVIPAGEPARRGGMIGSGSGNG